MAQPHPRPVSHRPRRHPLFLNHHYRPRPHRRFLGRNLGQVASLFVFPFSN
jgi:hypothetical protein